MRLYFVLSVLTLLAFSSHSRCQEEYRAWRPEMFAVESIVNRRIEGGKIFRLDEKYSASQSRGIVSYAADLDSDHLKSKYRYNPPKSVAGTFFSDSASGLLLQYGHDGHKCSPAAPTDLPALFGLEQIEAELDVPEFIVGPAKWLFYVQNNKNTLSMSDLSKDTKQNIRNIPSVEYHKVLTTKKGDHIRMSVFIADQDLVSNKHDAHPLLINFELNDKLVASLEFFGLQTTMADYEEAGTRLDPFMLNPLTDCDPLLQSNAKIPRLDLEAKIRFSFLADIEHFGAAHDQRRYGAFVAYDSNLAMLRIDREWLEGENDSREVVDFKINRRYHMINGDDKATSQCTVSLVRPASSASLQPPPLASLLLGAAKPQYIGRASVRGIDALAYMETDTFLPFWLEQPLSYRSSPSYSYNTWEPTKEDAAALSGDNPSKLITVIYLKESDPKELLLVEIIRVDETLDIFYDKRVISIYNFMWRLENLAPNGDSPIELFSLVNHCAIGDEEFKSEVTSKESKLLLESKQSQNDVLHHLSKLTPVERDLSLLRSLQDDWGLIVSMISDLQVVIVTNDTQTGFDGSLQRQQMLISFTLNRHTKNIVDLIRVGRGNHIGGNAKSHWANTLLQCYMMAASESSNVYFAYSALEKMCHINLRPEEDDGSNGPKMNAFKLREKGDLEVFQTEKNIGVTLDQHWFFVGDIDFEMSMRRRLHELRLKLDDLPAPIEFTVARYVVGSSESRTRDNLYKAITRIDGLGLVEQAGLSKRLDSSDNLEQCRVACLSDLHCRAYSYCIRGQEVECTLSRVSLGSKSEIALIKQASELAKGTNSFQVEIGSDGVKNVVSFWKRATCTTYIKRYLDYFKTVEIRKSRAEFYLVPVDHREQCASYFVQYNLQKHSKLSDEIRKSMETAERAISKSNDHQLTSAVELLRSDMQPLKQFYDSFVYIDWLDLHAIPENLTSKLYEFALKSLKRETLMEPLVAELLPKIIPVAETAPARPNYCMFSSLNATSSWELFQLKATVRAYRYDFESVYLYEETSDLSLKTQLTSEQIEASMALDYQRKPEPDVLKTGLELMKRGENIQVKGPFSRRQCARACLNQHWGPWPACRSFDYVIAANRDTGVIEHKCLLNSITLEQALANERSDLIERRPSTNEFEHWHYEPRVELGLTEMLILRREARLFEFSTIPLVSFRLKALGTSFLVILGLLTGIYLGTYLAIHRFIPRINGELSRSDSTAAVLDLPANIVTTFDENKGNNNL